MAAPTIDGLLAAIRQLSLDERRTLIAQTTCNAEDDTPKPPSTTSPSLLGLMADEPDVVDALCSAVYGARSVARMRARDE